MKLQHGARIFFLKDPQNKVRIRTLHELRDPDEKRAPPGMMLIHSTDEKLPCRKVTVTHIKVEDSSLENLDLGRKHNISIVCISRPSLPDILHPGRNQEIKVGDTVAYGCEHCKGNCDVQDGRCQCSKLKEYIDFDPIPGVHWLEMEYYIVPAHHHNTCFGKDLIPGATFAIDMSRHYILRMVAADVCVMTMLQNRLADVCVSTQSQGSGSLV